MARLKNLRSFRREENLRNFILDLSDAELLQYMEKYGADTSVISRDRRYLSSVRSGRRELSPDRRRAAREALLEAVPNFIPLEDYLRSLSKQFDNFDFWRSMYFLSEKAKYRWVYRRGGMSIFTNIKKMPPYSSRWIWTRVGVFDAPRIDKQWAQHIYFTPGGGDPFSKDVQENWRWENEQTNKRIKNEKLRMEFYNDDFEGGRFIPLGMGVYIA